MKNAQHSHDERCVWMDAGVLVYKLCDRNFECERCPLDGVLRAKDDTDARAFDAKRSSVRIAADVPPAVDAETARLLRPHAQATLPSDLAYTTDHFWVRCDDERCVLIGLDGLFAPLIPRSARFILASPQTHVERGQPLGWIYLEQRVIPLPSPLTGTVLRQNEQLLADPVVLTTNGYDFGWLVMLRPDRLPEERKHLLTPADMRPVMELAVGSLIQKAARRLTVMDQQADICMNDGGVPVASLYDALGEKSWVDLIRTVLLPRGDRNRDAT
ncbi:MAG: hypothetical protein IPP94_08615 [Ignavibacteria bacterium]|nr:hypothetical protein [Ignavibacteria bacterium]